MEANEKISSAIRGNAITLTGRFDTQLTCLGSSCMASVNPGEPVNSFTIAPVGDEVVAVCVSEYERDKKYGSWLYHHFLLGISQRESGHWIELQEPFIPAPDRMGQIVRGAGLSVRIGDEFFLAPTLVGDYEREKKLAKLHETYRLVPNAEANLLCRFIAGKATSEEVKAVAEAQEKQVLEVEVLRKQLEAAQRTAGASATTIAELSTKLQEARARGDHHSATLIKLMRVVDIEDGSRWSRRKKTLQEVSAILAEALAREQGSTPCRTA